MTGAFQLCFAPCTACEYQNSPGFAPCTACEYRNSPGFASCTPCEYQNSPGFASCTACEYQNSPGSALCMPCEYQNSPGFALCMVCEHSNVIQIAIKRASARVSGDKCRTIRLPPHPPPAARSFIPAGCLEGVFDTPLHVPGKLPCPGRGRPYTGTIIHPCGMSGGRMQFAPTRVPGKT